MDEDDQNVDSEGAGAAAESIDDLIAFESEGDGEDDAGGMAAAMEAAGLDDAALAQDEIDDLFGISMDEEEPTEGIHALLNSQYIQHRRLPVLEACFDRLVHTLSRSLRSLTAGDLELSLTDCSSVRFGNYIEEVPLPALVSIFRAVEWNDYGLVNIDSGLIYALIDVMLGGRRATPSLAIETRSFTSIETKLIERMVQLTLEDMVEAFKPLTDVTFELERMEANPSLVDIASPSNLAILFTIEVNMSDRGGRIQVLIPYATLEPINHLLEQMFAGDKVGPGSIWESHLSGEMLKADVELEASFGQQMVPLGEILSLEVGSTLTLRNKPGDPVMLRCGEATLVNGQVGRVGENMAIQVASWCNAARRGLPKSGLPKGGVPTSGPPKGDRPEGDRATGGGRTA